jgi:hypothetical protein
MRVYILAYLIAGAAVSLAHPRIRRIHIEFWQAKATGIGLIQKPFFGCLAFLIGCAIWPIAWINGPKALKAKKKNHFDELLNDPHIRKINPLFHAMLQLSADGTEADEIPGSVGEFGLTPTNPIPTVNVFGSQSYLDRLGTSDGRVVHHARRGSVVPERSKKPVDIYDLTDQQGNHLGTVYISPYHRKNSEKTPAGFCFR